MDDTANTAARPFGLWHNRDFLKLWAGTTISEFGSLITVVALPFAAILALGASPVQMALLRACDIAPALVAAPVAGVWIDRMRRRPLLIAADLGRAVLLASIPAAAIAGVLGFAQLYAVSLIVAILGLFFDVAYRAFLPSIVSRKDMVEANGKLSATASLAEVGAFSLAGWLVQAFTAPLAILIDAASFLFSAAFVWGIRSREQAHSAGARRGSFRAQAAYGARFIAADPILLPLTVAIAISTLGNSLFGTQYSLFALRTLGFRPGVLGVIYAVGGLSSLCGSLAAGPVSRRLGAGPAMIVGMCLWGAGELCLPLARSASATDAALLIAQQLSDGAAIVFLINSTTLRQTIPPDAILGRVNAAMRFVVLSAQLAGTLASGPVAETIGLRAALAMGACSNFVAAGVLALSPVATLADANDPVARRTSRAAGDESPMDAAGR